MWESRLLQVSFGTILSPVGLGLMVYGFCAYFSLLPGGDVSSLLLIYGFPLTLLGFALSYAQLPPVPCRSVPSAVAARESQATDIQKQVWHVVLCFGGARVGMASRGLPMCWRRVLVRVRGRRSPARELAALPVFVAVKLLGSGACGHAPRAAPASRCART